MSESRTPIHLGQADPRLQHNPGCLTLGAGESTLSVRTSQEVASLRHTQESWQGPRTTPVRSATTSGHSEPPIWLLCRPQLLPCLHEEPTTKASTGAEV